ncbi:hypothetical protein SAMN04487864_10387 [Succiniclasticum ruminis]|uniref:Autotransporter domain-containing protein n=1 Tax=Succiniclasticum ruminis TaxID=40841 RepID=A0A1G6JEC7_9FIRM|nr:autotransporter outer membrane beta-barrel domain-containing protein [Succiniclasticum ruminis]SDC17182.1 hypothetical protein SAMN04487864_10387 [Succiniclasticum ruminis]
MTKLSKKNQKRLAKLVSMALMCAGGLCSLPSVASAEEVKEVTWDGSVTGSTPTNVTPANALEFGGLGNSYAYITDTFVTQGYKTVTLLPNGDTHYVTPGYNNTTAALSGFTLNVNGGFWNNVYGAFSRGGGNVTGNKVYIKGGTVGGEVFGGSADISGNVRDNEVHIEDGNVNHNIIGGYSIKGNSEHNTVTINGGTIDYPSGYGSWIYGGRSNSGDAENNTVTISGGAINPNPASSLKIYGGFTNGNGKKAKGNDVTIGGNASFADTGNLDVYGGYAYSSDSSDTEASGNTVTIEKDATLGSNTRIFGGYATKKIYDSGLKDVPSITNNNTVNILKAITVKSLVGGWNATEGTGNTLNIGATGVTVGDGGVAGFQKIALTKDVQFTNDATVLNANTFSFDDGTLDISGATGLISATDKGAMTLLASSIDNNFSTLKLAYDDATKTSPKPLDATTPSVVVKSSADGATETLSNKVVLTSGTTHTVSLDKDNSYKNVLYTITGNGKITKVDLSNWNGNAADLTGYTGTSVPVATGGFTVPTEDATILTAPTETFFGEVTGARAYSDTGKFEPITEKGVTLSGVKTGGVKAEGTKLNYYAETMGVQSVALEAMKWDDGLAAATGYGFAGVTSIDASNLNFTFADADKAKLSKTSKMTLVDKATGLTAGAKVDGKDKTQTVDYTVNGATLTGTLTGTVSTAAGAVNYAATGMTLDSVDLAKWDGATASAVPAGWTKNDSGVTVATENMNNLPETSKVILVTDTANYFSDAKISETNKYKAYDFTPSAANGVTLSGKQSKGVRTAENGKKLEYAVGKMDVSEISFGEMKWGTGRAATTDYDFANTATVKATDLSFTFTDEQKADLSSTSKMTLLSDATNLAADKTVTGESRTQQVDYSVANGVGLTGTLTGTVATIAGAVNYTATGMTLDSVDLTKWDGATTSAVPKGWTAADKSVAVNNADAITVTPTKTQAILTAESGMFQDVNVAKTPVAFDPVTENGVTLTGTKTNSIQTTKTKVDNDTVSYVVGKKDVKSIAIGAIEWGGKALDGSSADYNYEAASVDSSKFDISNPEKVEANVAKILLEANDTLKDMTKDVNASYNDYEVTTGVLMNGMITGSLSKSGNNIVFATAENKATDLTFGKVEWTGSNPLLDHSKTLKNVSFDGATVDTSNIDFYKEMYIEADQTTTLVSNFGGNPKDIKGTTYKVGTAFDGEGSASMENGKLIFRTKTSAGVSEQTHKAVMGVEATMGLLASGIGHLDKVLDGFGNVSNAGSDGASTSASIGGGKDRYETNSHVNINSWSAAVGVGARKETKKGTLQYGIFGEYGKGSYTMHSDVGRSDGDAHYAGGGLMAKWTNKHDVYTEASFRLGRVSDSANDLLRDGAGNAYGYDIHATYYGAHVGLGKIFNYKGGKSLDVYGKFFYTKRDGCEFDAKQHYNLDSVNSSVLRIGARYGTTDKKWNWYGGLAYEYEFDGEAKGTVNGTAIRAASIKGSSVRGEFGMRMDATKDNPWRTDISIYGYGGKHRGFGGSVNVAYTF